jgi:coenzyme F420H2 oxidase
MPAAGIFPGYRCSGAVKMVAGELKTAWFTVVGSQEVLYVPDAAELDTAFEAGKAMAQHITQ